MAVIRLLNVVGVVGVGIGIILVIACTAFGKCL